MLNKYYNLHRNDNFFQMIIDTIFICFCEDCEKNDGINRPYFMSRGLMVRISYNEYIILALSFLNCYKVIYL